MRRSVFQKKLKSQQGAILLLILLTFITVAATVFFVSVGQNVATNKMGAIPQDIANTKLARAKEALIGVIVAPPASFGDVRPGTLPIPDSLGNGDYSGLMDTACLSNTATGLPTVGATSTLKRCLGKIPWRDLGLDVGSPEAHDPVGDVPWLAVSANLVFNDTCLAVLNGESLALSSPATAACASQATPYAQPTTLPHPWLSVFDVSGNLLSDRVAAVLILPGGSLTTETRTQSRSPTMLGNPTDYLDSIMLPLGCTSGCTTFDNAGMNNAFIQMPTSQTYPMDSADVSKRGNLVPFNDQLVYITVDELRFYIEKRVTGEMAAAMKTFKENTTWGGSYPWLMPLSASFTGDTSLATAANTTFGVFPYMVKADYAKYKTDFTWESEDAEEAIQWLTSPTTSNLCTRITPIGVLPRRFIRNPLVGSMEDSVDYAEESSNGTVGPFQSGSATPDQGACAWRGVNNVVCEQTMDEASYTFRAYTSNDRCVNNVSPTSVSFRVARTVRIDFTCTPDNEDSPVAYTKASSSNVTRWSKVCNSTSLINAITVTDTISNSASTSFGLLPRTASVYSLGNGKIRADNMRYHPLMPTWFYDNRWYMTAFAAVAPSTMHSPAIPSLPPCGTTTTLSVSSVSAVGAAVVQAGIKTGSQIRPASSYANYLESPNLETFQDAASALSNCSLTNLATKISTSNNDAVQAVNQ
jgi:hypothetical protein